MKQTLTTLGIALTVVALLTAVVYWKVSVWQECRETHSIGYCWQLIAR